MTVRIFILRELGRTHVPIGIAGKLVGQLSLQHERPSPSDERSVAVLQVLDGVHIYPSQRRKLYEPKLIEAYAGIMKFSGLEYVDGAWYAQEWRCEMDE